MGFVYRKSEVLEGEGNKEEHVKRFSIEFLNNFKLQLN
jgi:hypothetical protein